MKFWIVSKMYARRLCALCFVLACVSMWGCSSWFDEGTHFEWAEHRTEKSIVGFIDDSLVIAYNARNWYERTDEDGDQVGSGKGNQAVFIYNYRVQLDGPVFIDSLDNGMEENFNYGLGQLSDSVIWGGNVNHLTNDMGNVYSFWKIGKKPYKVNVKENKDGCSVGFNVRKLRTWLDGKIYAQGNKLTRGGDSCQYAILDTISKTLVYKRLDENLKWTEKCDDVRAWGDDVYCFMPGELPFEAVLLRNGVDTIDVPIKFSVGDFWGNILQPNANLCSLIDGKVVCSGVIWRGGLTFYENDEVVVNLE
ncbi:hypothetical protein [Fibrobacter succinogenes]|uniref:hypothetical protein n=1 Tax=Fibrobacter succinogenes TaxID=833 RepID=UPI0013D82730|nr:hypothetical protein [Fibrobacter succinogenes]